MIRTFSDNRVSVSKASELGSQYFTCFGDFLGSLTTLVSLFVAVACSLQVAYSSAKVLDTCCGNGVRSGTDEHRNC